jgi:Zn-dependent protease with chaperone function
LLDAPERDAVLAHELAHLRLRHHRLLFFAQVVTATLGPLARRARAALGRELEVIADQAAVTATADPRTLARALAKTVLAGQPATAAPAFATNDERDLVYRLERLTTTPRNDRHILATAALTLLAAELLIIVGATLERAGIALCLATAAIAWLHRRAVRAPAQQRGG